MSAFENVHSIELPEEWRTADVNPRFVEVVGTVDLPRGRQAVIVMLMLTDGTNIIAISWDRGTRFVRATAHTNWAIEEKFIGASPAADEGVLLEAWKSAVELLSGSVKDTRAEIAADPEAAELRGLAVAVVSDPVAMDYAWEHYEHRDRMTRDQFEELMRELAYGGEAGAS